jgi:hypothetical protein
MLVADHLAHRAKGRRDGLAESLSWTYDRLEGSTARLLRSLTVFGGSFSATMVRDLHRLLDGSGAEARVADSFSTIVRTSLAVPDQLDVGRFRLLETTRQHLRPILTADEVRELNEAHAALMLERARRWGPKIRTREADHAVSVLRADAVDLHQAVNHLVAANRIDDAAALVTSVFQFAMFDLEPALMASAVRIADRASEHTTHASEVFGAAATASWFVGDFDRAVSFGERALITAGQVGGSTIWARTALVDAHGYAGHLDELTRHFPLLVNELGSSDDPFWNVNGLGFQAIRDSMFGKGDHARSHADRAMATARQLGNPYCTYWALYALARAVEAGDPATAIESLGLAMTVARQVGGRWNITLALVEWLALHRRVGRLDDMQSMVLDLLDLVSRSGNRSELADTLREAAHYLAARGQDELAAIAMLARRNLPSMPGGASDVAGDERLLSTLHARLGDQWLRLELRANSLPEHELIELCREALSASSPT